MARTDSASMADTSKSSSKKQKTKRPVRPTNAYLASLKAATLLKPEEKAFLPLELIAQILDYLPPADLVRCAQVSKRLQEMVYDDTRWTQKLRLMGLWNEAEARQRFEEAMKRKMEAQQARDPGSSRRTGVDLPGHLNGDALGGRLKPSETLFDAHEGDKPTTNGHNVGALEPMRRLSMQTNGAPNANSSSLSGTSASLDILAHVRSTRGHARQEFGKTYGALAPYYYDIAQGSYSTDARLFRTFSDPEQQAKVLSNIRVFAKCDVTQGCFERQEKLDYVIGSFEHTALREFEGGYYAREYDGRMHKYAHVLAVLNGAAAVVDMFIDKNPALVQKSRYGKPMECLENPTASSVDLKPSQGFFHSLSSALDEQVSVIERVFPPTVDVMLPLMHQLAKDVICGYIDPLFTAAQKLGTDTYIQIVAGIFGQSLSFVRSLYPAKGSEDHFHGKVAKIIHGCFEPHIDVYLASELENLQRTTRHEVESWERRLSDEEASAESFFMSNVNRTAAKRDFMASFKKVIMMPVNVLPGMSTTTKPTNPTEADLTTTGRPSPSLGTDRPNTPRLEAPTTELAAKTAIMNSRLEGISSLFSIEVALHLVHAAQSSIARASLFVQLGGSYGAAARNQCQAIFVHLLQVLGHRHIKSGFDKAVLHLSNYNARDVVEHGASGVKPLVTFLELVNVGDLIQQMVDVFFGQQLVANKLTDRDDFLDVAVKEKKRFEQMLDERVAAGLNKGIDVLMDEVDFICSTTQAATDFRPGTWSEKSGTAGMGTGMHAVTDIGPTKTAVRVVELVASHTGMLTGSTDKNMLDVFNQEVGVRLFTTLCKHLKRQRISTDGAIILISDTNLYFGWVQGLKNKELLSYFRALRELSQIFLVDGKDAKELATIIADGERYGGIFRVEEVLEFAERRADWYQIKGNVEKNLYGMGCCLM